MKTFTKFVTEAYLILEEKKEGRSGPKYNYEVALVNLYNYLIRGEDKGNNKGKILRGAVSRGDTDTVVDILADELNQAKNNEKHPLHFSNASDEGFSGKKKTDSHRDAYYQELEDQFYTFLNDSQSKLGKNLISQGYVVKRLGEDKIPLSKTGKEAYGKEKDTSKADIVFQHPTRPERVNYSSLKKASGAVSASAGAEETAGNYTIGMKSALKLALKSGRITKEEAKKLENEGTTRIAALKDAMSSSKGMGKEQQKDLLPELDRLRGEVERIIPGTERETAKEQLSGKGKYGRGIDSFLSTGRGGGRKRKPEEVSGTHQRMRLGKGTTKTTEGPVQRPVTSTGDIKAPRTGEPSTYSSFSRRVSSGQQDQQQKPDLQTPAAPQTSLSQQEPTPQSAQRQERIPQLAQSIASRGLQIPKGIKLQHMGNFIRNQAAHQARIQQVQQAQAQTQQPVATQSQPPTQPQPTSQAQPKPQQVQPSVPQAVEDPTKKKKPLPASGQRPGLQ